MTRVDFDFYLITDRRRTGNRDLLNVIEQACKAGLAACQLREKDLTPRELFALAREVRAITARHGCRLFINDRYDVAKLVGADGVHLTEQSIPADAIRELDSQMLIGVSTHSLASGTYAERCGADFVTFGPVFDTPSKRRYGPPQGLDALSAFCKAVQIPVFALGGINHDRRQSCLDAGAHGVACIGAVLQAIDVHEAVTKMRNH